MRLEDCGIVALRTFDTNLRDDRLGAARHGTALREVPAIRVRRQRIRREGRRNTTRGFFAELDEFRCRREIGIRESAEVGRDQNVLSWAEQRKRRADVLLRQDVDRLRGQADQRRELFARHQRRSDVHRDNDIGAHLAHDIDRQIVDEPAVTEDLAIDFDRREDARHRHAGA